MVRFESEDLVTSVRRLAEWIEKDIFHRKASEANNWVAGDCLILGWIYDDEGPVMFLRANAEGEYVRVHVQFAPEDQVSRMRQAKAILKGWPLFVDTVREPGRKGIVFQSINPSLINFMKRLGFADWKVDEYLLSLE